MVDVRKGMPSVQLSKAEFARRFRDRFFDPAFDKLKSEIDSVIDTAWTAYDEYRKNPRTRRAGKEFSDPDYNLPVEWLATRERLRQAEIRQKRRTGPSRILLINGSARSDKSCPGEMSKTFRLVKRVKSIVGREPGFKCDVLDLSRLTSEYGRNIHPCKACVSTAQPLCHWPCSCYPNFAMGQVADWMSEIYPMWAAAHGVMIITPVNWYQAPSTLKLMIDRLVCADGGNPDPTSTQGKNPTLAKEIELAGWPYPRHLAGRVFSVVAHGDAAGVETLARNLSDWLSDIGMIAAGHKAVLGTYVGYLRPYATSHDDLDRDTAFQDEVAEAAKSLIEAVGMMRAGKLRQPGAGLREIRPK